MGNHEKHSCERSDYEIEKKDIAPLRLLTQHGWICASRPLGVRANDLTMHARECAPSLICSVVICGQWFDRLSRFCVVTFLFVFRAGSDRRRFLAKAKEKSDRRRRSAVVSGGCLVSGVPEPFMGAGPQQCVVGCGTAYNQ